MYALLPSCGVVGDADEVNRAHHFEISCPTDIILKVMMHFYLRSFTAR